MSDLPSQIQFHSNTFEKLLNIICDCETNEIFQYSYPYSNAPKRLFSFKKSLVSILQMHKAVIVQRNCIIVEWQDGVNSSRFLLCFSVLF